MNGLKNLLIRFFRQMDWCSIFHFVWDRIVYHRCQWCNIYLFGGVILCISLFKEFWSLLVRIMWLLQKRNGNCFEGMSMHSSIFKNCVVIIRELVLLSVLHAHLLPRLRWHNDMSAIPKILLLLIYTIVLKAFFPFLWVGFLGHLIFNWLHIYHLAGNFMVKRNTMNMSQKAGGSRWHKRNSFTLTKMSMKLDNLLQFIKRVECFEARNRGGFCTWGCWWLSSELWDYIVMMFN